MTNKRIKKILYILFYNPKLFFKRLANKIKSLRHVKGVIGKKINGVLFEFDFGLDRSIKDMYIGDYEVEVIDQMKRLLKEGDIFIDVGANIGYLSAIGAGIVGETGQVHSFEPVPQFFQRLKKLADMNPGYKIITNQCALGEFEGNSFINTFNKQNICWNTMIPNYMPKDDIKETIAVPVKRLDRYINDNKIKEVSLIKIDVEGFEFPVLKGLGDLLKNGIPIICEISISAPALLNYTHSQLAEYISGYGYKAYNLISMKELDLTALDIATTVLFSK